MRYLPGDETLAYEAHSAVTHALQRIEQDLGIVVEEGVRVTLVRGQEAFLEACGGRMPEWAMAAALPAEMRIVVDAALARPATADDLRLTLFHEAVHLALGAVERGRPEPLPLWFHEGVAQWLSDQSVLQTDPAVFIVAAEHGDLIPLAELSEGFPPEPERARLAYAESVSFIKYLTRARSRAVIRWIIEAYETEPDFPTAFRKAVGRPLEEVEQDWIGSRKSRYPWVRTVLRLLGLTGIMALLTVATFLIVKWRSRRQHREWEFEESWRLAAFDGEPVEEEDEPDEPEEPWSAND